MKRLLIAFIILITITLVACGENDEQTTEDHSEPTNGEQEETASQESSAGTVVTSIYPLEFIISEIAGDVVDVETVIPPGADAHTYEPSTRDMIDMSNHDAFFYVGNGLEVFADTLASTLEGEGVEAFALADHEDHLFAEITTDSHAENSHEDEDNHDHENENSHDDEHNHDHEDEHEHEHNHAHEDGELDLHFWLDPARMTQAGELILSQLKEMYPDHADTFDTNYESFSEQMNNLDQSFKSTLGDQQVDILVAHEAFGYWEQEYGIQQHGIRGLSSSQDPSQKELQELFKTLQERNLNHVILEKNRDDSLAQTIADEFDLTIYELHSLETITEDDIEQGADYVDIMKNNLEVLEDTINQD
ncbi:metal ABC transporter substrate-binding protein [Alkalibacillus salilacus]|uniref:Zinc transport system substrate-binding protein n=1 Tax=Alkalibacillus salilacus TaxID=284582 RepID=A0ABT9VEZ2_9BACI|nr:zinc ABC transporter substrate-binding protein [Alkalibacillus salilacus]MDQ0159546.1 zinc transport system substrate-binding protein [Alkalibacillus salilacus]